MLTITLPPDLEKAITERAQQQGTTAELHLMDYLRKGYLPEKSFEAEAAENRTMADFFEGYAGAIDSREIVPGGAQLSKETDASSKNSW